MKHGEIPIIIVATLAFAAVAIFGALSMEERKKLENQSDVVCRELSDEEGTKFHFSRYKGETSDGLNLARCFWTDSAGLGNSPVQFDDKGRRKRK